MAEKAIKVRKVKAMPNLYEAYVEGGGELPDYLKGERFTNPTLAQAAINTYNTSIKRSVARAAAKSRSRAD